LRQLPTSGASLAERAADLRWLHVFLTRLAGVGFPSPRPLPAFYGQSSLIAGGELWEIVSFLPGRVVGWSDEPPLEEIGALLGRYHNCVRHIGVTGQRPGALPLAEVPAILLSPQLEAARISPDVAAQIRRQAGQLADDLTGASRLAGANVVIHGDFTAHNVMADGAPPRATGVIDFALAHAETPLADIGYGLWRSGRSYQEADHLDLSRISRFLRGYVSAVAMTADQARAIPVYIRGRGLQMIAKRVRAGHPQTGMLAQVRWLSANAEGISDALENAVRWS
jgi:Ser/Thr protein kinase RdoA (MazF antagonist)